MLRFLDFCWAANCGYHFWIWFGHFCIFSLKKFPDFERVDHGGSFLCFAFLISCLFVQTDVLVLLLLLRS